MITSLLASGLTDMWNSIINLFSFIPNYGWMIVVFTICLKLVLSPLDFWQRKVSRDTAKKQAKLQPEIAKLQKKFGNNRQVLNQKTMELYKREKFNIAGSCVGMLVNLALTLFIFISLFTSLIAISHDKISTQYETLRQTYETSIVQTYGEQYSSTDFKVIEDELYNEAVLQAQTELGQDATEEQINTKAEEIFNQKIASAQTDVLNKYNEIKDSWLWVSSVWRPDTSASSFPDFANYAAMSDLYNSDYYKGLIGENATDEKIGNGYFILVILAAVVTYLAMTVTQLMQTKKKKDNTQTMQAPQNTAMKVMKYVMPILMIIFTIGYSAAFAIYIVTMSAVGALINYIFSLIFSKKFDNFSQPDNKTKNSNKNQIKKPDYVRQ